MATQCKGFTLIELLVTVSLLAILLSLGIPALEPLLQAQRVESTRDNLATALAYARSESIKRQRPVLAEGIEGEWDNGWRVFADLNGNGWLDPDEPLLLEGANASGIIINGNEPVQRYVRYIPAGNTELLNGAFQAGTLSLCHQSGKQPVRTLIISITGRVRKAKGPAGFC